MTVAIQLRQLEVRRQDQRICHVPELNIPLGEKLLITGANGTGKTTLLRVLMGLETNHTGHCQISIPVWERQYVHQQPYLLRGTVAFNAGYGLKARRSSKQQRAAAVLDWLEVFQIKHLADRQSQTLSGGEHRRVALARAFVLKPQLLLLDEPFAELDESGIACVFRALEETQATVLIASPSLLSSGHGLRVFELT